MRVVVDHDLLVAVQQLPGIRHAGERSDRRTGRIALIYRVPVAPDPLLDDLDPEQRTAVLSAGAPLCIVAPAGSGKTRVLTRRIAHRIRDGSADPSHVLVITFTRRAAGELAGRLRRARAARRGRRRHVPRSGLPAPAPALGGPAAAGPGAGRRPGSGSSRRRWATCAGRLGAVPRRRSRPRSTGRGPAGRPAGLRRRGRSGRAAHGARPGRGGRALRALRGAEAGPADDRLRRPAVPGRRRDGAGRRLRRRRPLALPPPVRRRVPGREPAPAGPPGGLARRPARPVRGRRPAAGHLRVERCRRPLARGLHRPPPGRDRRAPAPQPSLDPPDRRPRPRGADRERSRAARWPAGPTVPRPGPSPSPARRPRRPAWPPSSGTCAHPAAAGEPSPCWPAPTPSCSRSPLRSPGRASRTGGGPGPSTTRPRPPPSSSCGRSRGPARSGRGWRTRSAGPAGLTSARDEDPEEDAGHGNAAGEGGHASTLPAAFVRAAEDLLAQDPAADGPTLRAWLVSGGSDGLDVDDDAVALSTFHAAKGLEWPTVVVIGLVPGLVPHSGARTPAARDEERRLLHVAVTRAEREVVLTWYGPERSPYLDVLDQAVPVGGPPVAPPADLRPVPSRPTRGSAARRATGVATRRRPRRPRRRAGRGRRPHARRDRRRAPSDGRGARPRSPGSARSWRDATGPACWPRSLPPSLAPEPARPSRR